MEHPTTQYVQYYFSLLDDCSAQFFPYNIFAYCSICRADCKFAINTKKCIMYNVIINLKDYKNKLKTN
jgi:hypothetical protein